MDEIKARAKQIAKILLKKILRSKIVILTLIIIIFIFLLLPSFVYFIKIDDGTFKESEWNSVSYAASNYTKGVSITAKGIQTGMTSQDLWDKIKKEGSNVENYLDKPEELQKMMNAEIITQYPKIETDGLDGIVEFERTDSDGNKKKLTYTDSSTFNTYKDNYINNGDAKVLDYFTLDDSGNAIVAVLNKTTETLETNDMDINISDYTSTDLEKVEDGKYSKTKYEISTSSINYKSVVQKYSIPFQYLWSLLIITEDKDFVLGLANLVEESEIIVGIYDNKINNVEENIYTYKKEERIDTYAELTIKDNYNVTGYDTSRYWLSEDSPNAEGNYDSKYKADINTDDTEYKITNKIEKEINTVTIGLAKADTWIVNYSRNNSSQVSSPVSTQPNESDLDDTDYIESTDSPKDSNQDSSLLNNSKAIEFRNEIDKYINSRRKKDDISLGVTNSFISNTATENVEVSYVKCWYFNHLVERKKSTIVTSSSSKIILETPVVSEKTDPNSKTDNFVTLLNKSTQAKNYIIETSDWLFELLEINDTTADMVDLTKYLLNKATNSERFGKIDINFDSLYGTSDNSFTSVVPGDFDVSDESMFIKDIETLRLAFTGYSRSQKLIENAQAFLAMQNQYKVNAIFAAAVSITETGAGNAGHAIDGHNNWFNFRGDGPGGWKQYSSVIEAIGAFGNNIANGSYYYQAGKKTVATIGPTYCPNTDEYPTQADDWIEHTIGYIKNFYDAAGITISTSSHTAGNVSLTGENKEKMEKLLAEAIRIADDDRYTYSQANRNSEFQYDCSSFVYRLYSKYFDSINNLPTYTGASGYSRSASNPYYIGTTSEVNLQPGDVLLHDKSKSSKYPWDHVVIYLGNRFKSGSRYR